MTKFDHSLAVVIGINDYKNGIARLKTAVPDAVAIATILRDTYQYQLIHPNYDPGGVIANKHATLQNLKTLLTETLPNQIKPTKRDRLLFYFAGHGVALNNDDGPAGFLVPQDADLKSNDTLIPMRTLYKTLESLDCHHLLVILDCCFAGTFRWSSIRKLLPLPQIITKTHYDRFIKSSAWQAITSAAHNQEAFDFIRDNRGRASNSNHSPFAQALLEALQGAADIIPPAREGKPAGDGVITATELYLYLRDRVELDSQDRQTPGIWTLPKHDRGEYIFLVPKRELDLAETPELNEDNNPYRGLKPFDEQHSRFFFGREELVKELAQRLSEQEHRLSVVLGASGSGKSSLVKAGLIPHLRKEQEEQWKILKTMRPGEYPFTSLAQVIEEIAPNSRNILQQDPDVLVEIITSWSRQHPQTKLLIVIDQFEELITLTRQTDAHNQPEDSKAWQPFLKLLAPTLETCPQFHLIVTLRSDFETRFLDSALSLYWAKARFPVRPMRSDELREAIENPASEMALYFEPPNLVDRLIDEVGQMPGALPLLSFTLSELYIKLYKAWQEEGKEERTLTIDAEFEHQGGVAGSLTSRANKEYNNLGDAKLQTTMRRVMLRMLTVEGWEVARRQVPDSELVYPDDAENERVKTVIEGLVNARLVVKEQGTEEPYVEPAHDYLVRGWDRLQDWIKEDREDLTLQQRLTPAANDWKKNNKAKGLLLPNGDRLNQLEKIFNQKNNWLNKQETEFIKASIYERDLQQRKAREQQAKTQLLQKADQIDNLITSQPLNALILAIQAIGENLEKIPDTILTAVQSSLHKTVSLSRECNFIDSGTFSVDFSPDGEMIVSGGGEGVVQLWGLKGNLINKSLSHNGSSISTVAFSPDGNNITSGGGSGFYLWAIDNTNKSLHLVQSNPDFSIESIAFSPSEKHKRIITGSNQGEIQVWDYQGNLLKTQPISPKSWVNKDAQKSVIVAFSNSGKYITDGVGLYWGLNKFHASHILNDPKITISSSQEMDLPKSDTSIGDEIDLTKVVNSNISISSVINSVAWSRDDQKIVIGSDQGNMFLWDIKEGSFGQTFTGYESLYPIKSVAFNPNEDYIVSGSFDQTVRLWDLEGKLINTPFIGHDRFVYSVAFSPDGKNIVSGGLDGIRIWDTHGYTPSKVFEDHQGDVNVAVFSSDGNYIFSGGDDGNLRIWDIKGNLIDQTSTNHQDAITCLSTSLDGKYIVSGSYEGNLRLWSIQDRLLHQLFVVHQDGINAVAFSPRGNLIASGGESGIVKLWNLEGNPVGQPFIGHQSRITSIAFSPDGTMLASGSSDGSLGLWNINGQCIIQPSISDGFWVDCLAFSPDGQYIISGINNDPLSGRGFGGVLKLWDLEGNLLGNPFTGHEDSVTCVAFSPDGTLIVSSSVDGTVRLWDQQGNAVGSPFIGHKSRVTSVDFDPTGKQVVSSGVDRKVRLWSVDWLSWLKSGCDRLRHHPVFKNPETEEQKQACQTCYDYVWHSEIGADKLYHKGKKRLEEENYQEALSIFNLAIQFNENHANTYYLRRECYLQLSNQNKATEDFQKAAFLYQQQGKTIKYQQAMNCMENLQ